MVVKILHTLVAITTMGRQRWAIDVARGAKTARVDVRRDGLLEDVVLAIFVDFEHLSEHVVIPFREPVIHCFLRAVKVRLLYDPLPLQLKSFVVLVVVEAPVLRP